MHKASLPYINTCMRGHHHAFGFKEHQVPRSALIRGNLHAPGVQLRNGSGRCERRLALVDVGNQATAVKSRGQGVAPVAVGHPHQTHGVHGCILSVLQTKLRVGHHP